MKKMTLLCTVLYLFLNPSCKKGSDAPGATIQGNPVVKISHTSILADDFETSQITVTDQNNNDITALCTVTINNATAASPGFHTQTAGAYTVKASVNGRESLPVTITATNAGPSKYSQKVLAEEFTGTWCGNCPRVSYALERLQEQNPKVIVTSIHNNDPFTIPVEVALRNRWLVTGFPTAMINRSFKWNEQPATISSETNKWAPLGLAIETTISGSTLTGNVKTEFNVNAGMKMRIGIMLLQDSIIQPQTNYYNTTPGSPLFGSIVWTHFS